MAPPQPTIDGYTIESLIDTGGFSQVFRATQHGLDRSVAVKLLNSTFEDERQQRTFERECKLMGQLSTHPNIVTVLASALADDRRPAIVMELYQGTYRAEEQLDIAEVIDVGAKVADALQAIHDQGIVHRDIKPHNIFISQHGQPAIGDFGISSVESERTVTGGAGFSINYAPPEVFEEGGAGAAGDVYSLGATLYQLASGEVPFPHSGDPTERTRATVQKIITAPPPSLRRGDAPEALDRLLRKCMAKDPQDRPARPADVAGELRQIQAAVGLPDRRTPAPSTDRLHQDAIEATIDRKSAFTDNVTAVRDREQPAGPTEADVIDRARSRPSNRNLLIGVGVAAGLILISALVIAFGFTGGGSQSSSTTLPQSTVAISDFEVLVAPGDLTVEETDEGSYELSWQSSGDALKYQIHLVGSTDNRLTDATTYIWSLDDDADGSCFEVRTVNASETRVSQSAAGPVCSS